MILPYRHVETALLDFVLHVAAAFLALVAQHLGEYPLEGVVAYWLCDGVVAVVADVEGGAEEVARTVGGILVVTLQPSHIVHGAKHAGDNELVEGNSLGIETVEEGLSDVVQKHGGTGYKVGNGAGETVDVVVGTLSNVDEFLLTMFGIFTVFDGLHTPTLSGDNLYALTVGEGCFVVGDAADAVEVRGVK